MDGDTDGDTDALVVFERGGMGETRPFDFVVGNCKRYYVADFSALSFRRQYETTDEPSFVLLRLSSGDQ